MQDITLQQLLEAGCHFGHKAERWHPKANSYIYTKKDGIHIIDLAATKSGLDRAIDFIRNLTAEGKEILFVGTKRQAKGVLKEEATAVDAPYFSERWIGGFLTNWEEVKKNIEKILRLTDEQATGAWKKYPKHERTKLARYLVNIKIYYGGVLKLTEVPAALFVVDIKKEDTAVREAKRVGIPVVAIVDTNSDPTSINYCIPANDDAVGSVQLITHALTQAYAEGKAMLAKPATTEKPKEEAKAAEPKKPKKRGRPKKTA